MGLYDAKVCTQLVAFAGCAQSVLMTSRPSLVTPSGRFEMYRSSKFPLAKMPRLSIEPVGLQEIQVGGEVNNGTIHNSRLLTSPTHAHTTSYFAPNECKGVVNPFGLAIYKG